MSESMLVAPTPVDRNESFYTTPSEYNDPKRCWEVARKNFNDLYNTHISKLNIQDFLISECKVTQFVAESMTNRIIEIITSR